MRATGTPHTHTLKLICPCHTIYLLAKVPVMCLWIWNVSTCTSRKGSSLLEVKVLEAYLRVKRTNSQARTRPRISRQFSSQRNYTNSTISYGISLFSFLVFLSFQGCTWGIWRFPSQELNRIRAVAADLCHNHGNSGSDPHLQPTPQPMAMLDL